MQSIVNFLTAACVFVNKNQGSINLIRARFFDFAKAHAQHSFFYKNLNQKTAEKSRKIAAKKLIDG
jgi:hypothetical protein